MMIDPCVVWAAWIPRQFTSLMSEPGPKLAASLREASDVLGVPVCWEPDEGGMAVLGLRFSCAATGAKNGIPRH